MLLERFNGVMNSGRDMDMSKISSCECKLSDCEEKCPRHSSCQNVAMANDTLVDFENFFDEVKEKVFHEKQDVVVLDEEKTLHIVRNNDDITIRQFDVMKNDKLWYSRVCYTNNEEKCILSGICRNDIPTVVQFAEHVLSHGESFFTKYNGKLCYFVQNSLYPYLGKMVYGNYGFSSQEDMLFDMDQKLEVVALVIDKEIYVIDRSKLDIWSNDNLLPEHVQFFSADEVNERMEKEIFPIFIDSLKTKEVSSDYSYLDAEKIARIRVLTQSDETLIVPEKLFNLQDAVKILCGAMDFKTEAFSRLEKDRERWTDLKSKEQEIQEYMRKPDIVADWELRMAKALRDVDGKNVTVEFEFNGKTESGKMPIYRILDILKKNDYFDWYDFVTAKEGKELFFQLGVSSYAYTPETNLYCKNITKITYGKKTVYEKED